MADPEATEVEQAVRDTEDELLKSAFAPKEEPAKEPEPAAEAPTRARDPETGRFARAEAAVESKPAANEQPPDKAQAEQPQAEKPVEEEILPSWRAREINEERRRIQAENDQMRAEYARMQARMAQFERVQQQAAAPAPPDPVLDPQGFAKHIREEIRNEYLQQAAADRLTNNLEIAHTRYGERFERAYEALVVEGQRGNGPLVRHLIAQGNPGEAIVRWYSQNEVMRETGGDLPSYRTKTREQLLKDPEFLAQAVEAHHRLATGGGQPNTVVKLPPSLSKATGTAEVPVGQARTDGSEAALFAFAMQPKPRR